MMCCQMNCEIIDELRRDLAAANARIAELESENKQIIKAHEFMFEQMNDMRSCKEDTEYKFEQAELKVNRYESALQRIIDDPYTESYEAIARKALGGK